MSETPANMDRRVVLKQALRALDEMRSQVQQLERGRREPIAVIGVGCRFPGGADDPAAYWQVLRNGVDAVSEFPADRWPDDASGRSRHVGGFLSGIDRFDPLFFGISPREAVCMDPQHRLVLEVAWDALEHAGQSPDRLRGSLTGVFIGITTNEYVHQLSGPASLDVYAATGNSHNAAAGRISYLLGFHGPSVAIDTACSSSLASVHLACQSLRAGDSDLALAGGVSVLLLPQVFELLASSGMTTADGRCRTFDAAANGFVRGEGCGLVALKRLSDALTARDPILAVIRGSAVNQDGASSGLTVPNGTAQAAVIRRALDVAGVRPADVGYVEAHGTGTSLGDPIELEALDAVLGDGRPADRPLVVGSVKTNFGHLEASAGVAGLIKAVLAVHHREIPPHLHFRTLNPNVTLRHMQLVVPTAAMPWPADRTRIAGVSSFGLSGTNGHVVVEQAPDVPKIDAEVERPATVLTLSAKTDTALAALAERWRQALAEDPSAPLADVAFTANTGRSHFSHRLAIVGGSREELTDRLAMSSAGSPRPGTFRGHARRDQNRIAFLFTGQGSQYVGMGRALYDTQPTFRRLMDECAEVLRGHLDVPLIDLIYGAAADPSRLNETRCAQPALFALEYSLTELWKSWGVKPAAVIGHSLGEYVAACVAGIFSLEDALKLVAERGRLMGALPAGGGMAAVELSADRVAQALSGTPSLSIAAVNAADQTVVSGDLSALEEVSRTLTSSGVRVRRLATSHAFHSALMEPMLDAFDRVLGEVRFAPPRLPLVSNVTGGFADADEIASPEYWRRHIRAAVQFADGLRTLDDAGYHALLEVGPHPTLVALAPPPADGKPVVRVASLRQNRDAWDQMLESVAQLYVSRVPVDWTGFDRDYPRRKVGFLPTYPYERQRYWIDPAPPRAAAQAASGPEWADWIHDLSWRPVSGPAASRPAIDDVEARAQDTFAQLVTEHDLGSYEAGQPQLDALCAAYVVHALRELGWNPDVHKVFTSAALIDHCGVQRRHGRLFDRLLAILGEDGVLRREGDGWAVARIDATPNPETRRQNVRSQYPAFEAEIDLLARCGRRLADVLRGRATAVEVLFSDGNAEQLERVYQDAPGARAFNTLIARTVADVVAHVPADRPLRVLEIGAGTGGTTSAILPILARRRCEYVYTDISAAFFTRATVKFRDYPFVEYRTLDVSQDPARQGFAGSTFDLVIAANVLHATPDLRQTLKNVDGLVAPDGAVVMLEGTTPQRLIDLTFGLTDEWWGFRDTDLRPAHVLLSAAQWRAVWGERGFTESIAIPRGTGSGLSMIVARRPQTVPAEGGWLIFGDNHGYGDALAAALRARGDLCTVAGKGESYHAAGADSVTVNPARPDQYRRLVQELTAAGRFPLRGVVHCWGIDETLSPETSPAALDAAVERGCGSALYVVQALADAGAAQRPRLVLVTRGAQDVVPADPAVAPAQTMLWGFARVVALEHPDLRCLRLDLDPASGQPASDVPALVDALVSGGWDEDQVARRAGRWFALRLVPSAVRTVPSSAMTYRSDGTYLITGGTAGLGLLTARRMVDQGARHLILMSRSEPTESAAAAIAAMEQDGAIVRVVRGDVGDPAVVTRAIDGIDGARAPLRGIVHSAGALDDGALFNQTWERFRTVLAAKMHGTWNLDVASRDCRLDFFVVYSSSSAIFGSAGQANHAAGNAFVDGLIRARRKQGLGGLTINWAAWSEIGAAARRGVVDRVATQGLDAIDPERGIQVFEHAVQTGVTQMVVAPIRWNEFLRGASVRPRFFDAYAPAAARIERVSRAAAESPIPHAEPEARVDAGITADVILAAPPSERAGMVLRFTLGEIAGVVRLESVRADQPLGELGIDSLMAVEIRNRISRGVGITVPIVSFLDGTTGEELASRILAELQARPGAADAPLTAGEAQALLDRLDNLSETDLDGLLERLEAAGMNSPRDGRP